MPGQDRRPPALPSQATLVRVGQIAIDRRREVVATPIRDDGVVELGVDAGDRSEITNAPQASASYSRFDRKPSSRMSSQWSLSTIAAEL